MSIAIASFYRAACTPDKYCQIVEMAQRQFGDRLILPPSAVIEFKLKDGTQEDAEAFSAAVDAMCVGLKEEGGW